MQSKRELINRCYINGNWRSAKSGRTISVQNPSTGGTIGEVPDLSEAEATETIHSASDAFKGWKRTTAAERSELLKALHRRILESKSDLAGILTTEQGKPLGEAEREIVYGASFIEWFAEEAKRIYGETIPSSSPDKRIFVTREPVGVVAGITPWNFPNAMITRKMAAALAAGCTFISKPAPETPFSALALAEICHEIGFPPGVFNVITGDAPTIASAFMKSPEVRKITFTGSTEVGKLLLSQSAQTVKRVTMELGGNAPFIVFNDADIEKAVSGALFAKYRNAGQTCICINRFLVHEQVAEIFAARLVEESAKLKVGDGFAPHSAIGPLINTAAKDKVVRLLTDAKDRGATILCGGACSLTDLFVAPTVLANVKTSMSIWNEEIFGPICAVHTFSTEEEAVALANSTPYGLASYFYTTDLARAVRVSESLEFGMVGVNETMISVAQAPFGGIKQSGFGREGGREGIYEYLNTKYTTLSLS